MATRLLAKIDGCNGREYRIIKDDSKEYNKFGVYEVVWVRESNGFTYYKRARHLLDRFDTYTCAVYEVARRVQYDPIKV